MINYIYKLEYASYYMNNTLVLESFLSFFIVLSFMLVRFFLKNSLGDALGFCSSFSGNGDGAAAELDGSAKNLFFDLNLLTIPVVNFENVVVRSLLTALSDKFNCFSSNSGQSSRFGRSSTLTERCLITAIDSSSLSLQLLT